MRQAIDPSTHVQGTAIHRSTGFHRIPTSRLMLNNFCLSPNALVNERQRLGSANPHSSLMNKPLVNRSDLSAEAFGI